VLKKMLLVGIPVVIMLAVVAAIVVPRLLHESRIGTKAAGVWRETDSPQAQELAIRANPGAAVPGLALRR